MVDMLAIVSRYHEEISAASGLRSGVVSVSGGYVFRSFRRREVVQASVMNLLMAVASFIVAPLDED